MPTNSVPKMGANLGPIKRNFDVQVRLHFWGGVGGHVAPQSTFFGGPRSSQNPLSKMGSLGTILKKLFVFKLDEIESLLFCLDTKEPKNQG